MPYETLNKRYRLAQKQIDRDAAQLLSSVNELDRSTEPMATLESLKKVLERAMTLKRKVWSDDRSERMDRSIGFSLGARIAGG